MESIADALSSPDSTAGGDRSAKHAAAVHAAAAALAPSPFTASAPMPTPPAESSFAAGSSSNPYTLSSPPAQRLSMTAPGPTPTPPVIHTTQIAGAAAHTARGPGLPASVFAPTVASALVDNGGGDGTDTGAETDPTTDSRHRPLLMSSRYPARSAAGFTLPGAPGGGGGSGAGLSGAWPALPSASSGAPLLNSESDSHTPTPAGAGFFGPPGPGSMSAGSAAVVGAGVGAASTAGSVLSPSEASTTHRRTAPRRGASSASGAASTTSATGAGGSVGGGGRRANADAHRRSPRLGSPGFPPDDDPCEVTPRSAMLIALALVCGVAVLGTLIWAGLTLIGRRNETQGGVYYTQREGSELGAAGNPLGSLLATGDTEAGAAGSAVQSGGATDAYGLASGGGASGSGGAGGTGVLFRHTSQFGPQYILAPSGDPGDALFPALWVPSLTFATARAAFAMVSADAAAVSDTAFAALLAVGAAQSANATGATGSTASIPVPPLTLTSPQRRALNMVAEVHVVGAQQIEAADAAIADAAATVIAALRRSAPSASGDAAAAAGSRPATAAAAAAAAAGIMATPGSAADFLVTNTPISLISSLSPFAHRQASPDGRAPAASAAVAASALAPASWRIRPWVLVEFYAKWCGHCQRFAKPMERLGAALNTDRASAVRVAKVHCAGAGASLCDAFSVRGYPTLMLAPADVWLAAVEYIENGYVHSPFTAAASGTPWVPEGFAVARDQGAAGSPESAVTAAIAAAGASASSGSNAGVGGGDTDVRASDGSDYAPGFTYFNTRDAAIGAPPSRLASLPLVGSVLATTGSSFYTTHVGSLHPPGAGGNGTFVSLKQQRKQQQQASIRGATTAAAAAAPPAAPTAPAAAPAGVAATVGTAPARSLPRSLEPITLGFEKTAEAVLAGVQDIMRRAAAAEEALLYRGSDDALKDRDEDSEFAASGGTGTGAQRRLSAYARAQLAWGTAAPAAARLRAERVARAVTPGALAAASSGARGSAAAGSLAAAVAAAAASDDHVHVLSAPTPASPLAPVLELSFSLPVAGNATTGGSAAAPAGLARARRSLAEAVAVLHDPFFGPLAGASTSAPDVHTAAAHAAPTPGTAGGVDELFYSALTRSLSAPAPLPVNVAAARARTALTPAAAAAAAAAAATTSMTPSPLLRLPWPPAPADPATAHATEAWSAHRLTDHHFLAAPGGTRTAPLTAALVSVEQFDRLVADTVEMQARRAAALAAPAAAAAGSAFPAATAAATTGASMAAVAAGAGSPVSPLLPVETSDAAAAAAAAAAGAQLYAAGYPDRATATDANLYLSIALREAVPACAAQMRKFNALYGSAASGTSTFARSAAIAVAAAGSYVESSPATGPLGRARTKAMQGGRYGAGRRGNAAAALHGQQQRSPEFSISPEAARMLPADGRVPMQSLVRRAVAAAGEAETGSSNATALLAAFAAITDPALSSHTTDSADASGAAWRAYASSLLTPAEDAALLQATSCYEALSNFLFVLSTAAPDASAPVRQSLKVLRSDLHRFVPPPHPDNVVGLGAAGLAVPGATAAEAARWTPFGLLATVAAGSTAASAPVVAVSAFPGSWRLGERSWEDWARVQWRQCRGSLPHTRGYTCGLWLTIHTAAAAWTRQEAGAALMSADSATTAPEARFMHTLRSYLAHFFLCDECRAHFLGYSRNVHVPILAFAPLFRPSTSATADAARAMSLPSSQLSLWLWATHNTVNQRLAAVERAHDAGDPVFPKATFPRPRACPQCLAPDARPGCSNGGSGGGGREPAVDAVTGVEYADEPELHTVSTGAADSGDGAGVGAEASQCEWSPNWRFDQVAGFLDAFYAPSTAEGA